MAEILSRSAFSHGTASDPPRSEAFQQTLAVTVRCSGVGLHTGVPVEVTFRPADAGTGIVFRRTDLEGEAALIPARWDGVSDTRLCTTLRNSHGVSVRTVEHVMAALAGCEIDNVLVELDGPEPPAMDGSAALFVARLRDSGVVRQGARRSALRIRKPVAVGDRDRFACLLPADRFSVECEIGSDGPAAGRQCYRFATGGDFARDVAPARSSGLLREADALRNGATPLGGSLENASAGNGDRIPNGSGLRFADEIARHKVLDAVGDLYLAGAPIIGRFRGYRSGHELNNALLRALFRDPSAWEWEDPQAPLAARAEGRGRLV